MTGRKKRGPPKKGRKPVKAPPAGEESPPVTEETPKPTLEELTATEKARLEEELANKVDFLEQAVGELKNAKQLYKDCRKEVEERRVAVHQTNYALREVIRGRWRPPKPDPQKQLDFPSELDPDQGTDAGGGAPAVPEAEPEAESLWKSKPVTELGLPKTVVTRLENEGFTTLGVIVSEFEDGASFEGFNFSDVQISKIRSAVHKYRPKPPQPEETDEEGTEG